MKMYRFILFVFVLSLVALPYLQAQEKDVKTKTDQSKMEKKKMEPAGNPVIVFKTSLGSFSVELFQDKAPVTVKNFLSYVDEKFFDNTVFHRIIKNFMIQGGGFAAADPIKQKKTKAMIVNESTNGLKNERGTIAMARTNDPNSATSQFFINVVDNKSLNRGMGEINDPNAYGYAVFGKVVDGMDVVDKIREVKTGNLPAIALSGDQEMETTFSDVPQTKVVVQSVRRAESKK